MIRLIALDIDGTLLDSRWQVPPVNRDAIRRATDAGIEVALVTGRRFDFARPVIEQIEKQLRKLINVIKLRSLNGPKSVRRELALICVHAKAEQRAEVLRIVDIFRGKIVDAGLEHFIIEVTGEEAKIQAVLNLLKPIGIKKLARTGMIGLIREPK